MSGKAGRSGRKRATGQVFRFDFYYRIIPGQDPPELEKLLESIVSAKGQKRRDILRNALLGGAQQAQEAAETVEDSQMEGLFNEMFGEF